ncbi:MAG: ABC transporter ATP-binding protein [SAR202 cluster bacterium]|nr:ABC transporter ATP-binding protein [SAR202 cluster bacterium]
MNAIPEPGQVPAVKAEHLRKLYPVGGAFLRAPRSFIHAVDDVSFTVEDGKSLGLVGESGCGKTTTAKMVVKLIEPTSGEIQVRDSGGRAVSLSDLDGRATKRFRRSAQMIYQDPYESLNPRRTVLDTIAEPLVVQGMGTFAEREERVMSMMAQVGLTPVRNYLLRFPHELSGGQRQRVAIARALILAPKIVVADEPTSMLDVSVRSNIIQLMLDMRDRLGATYLYITHDVAVARYMCDQIAVMYLGKIVEMGSTEEILRDPVHPYTQALISAVPVPDPEQRKSSIAVKGGVARPIDPLPRCRFYDRCPAATSVCEESDHPSLSARNGGRMVACYNR